MAPKRKFFPKTDLSLPVVSHQVTEQHGLVLLDKIPPDRRYVTFPAGFKRKEYDFSRWYDVGIDAITFACQRQIERFLAKQDAEVTTATVFGYCDTGLKYFLSYLTLMSATTGQALKLASITRQLIDGFITSFDGEKISDITKKNRYTAIKSVLMALCQRGLIPWVRSGDSTTFPKNPFPYAHKTVSGESPLSTAERNAVNRALKTAIRPYFNEEVEPTSAMHGYALLSIALHAGSNTTSLLQMPPDCLFPHPKPNAALLVLYKARAHSDVSVVIRDSTEDVVDIELAAGLRPSTATLIRRAINYSDTLRNAAPAHVGNLVWLYRRQKSSQYGAAGDVLALTDQTLEAATKRLVKDYALKDADGKPLRLNVSRLRKTFENRIFEILDGDIAATAAAAGHTPEVAGSHYLRPDENSKRNWSFMGKVMTNELLTDSLGATEKTPAGHCADIHNGAQAPKLEDKLCTDFLNCIRCRNYVVTADDLYRLFSFYWRILHERSRMDRRRWKKKLGHIVRLIDRDVIEAGIARGMFNRASVESEKKRAFLHPHPFWQTISISSD